MNASAISQDNVYLPLVQRVVIFALNLDTGLKLKAILAISLI